MLRIRTGSFIAGTTGVRARDSEDVFMAFGMIGGATPPIAIEFGSSALKALQISADSPPALIAAAALPTPLELFDNPTERFRFQADGLASLIRDGGFRGKRVLCAAPTSRTLVQHMRMTKIDGARVTEQLGVLLQSEFNIDPSRVVIRHVTVPDASRHGGLEVICFAIGREAVFRQIEAVRAAKLEPVGVHAEHQALLRAFDHITRRASDADLTSVYIEIGTDSSRIIVAHGRTMVFAKTLQGGGRAFDAAAAQRMQCSAAEARARRSAMIAPGLAVAAASIEPSGAAASTRGPVLKLNGATPDPHSGGVGVASDRRHGAATPGLTAPLLNEKRRISRPVAEPDEAVHALIEEIGMCLRYYDSLFPGRSIGRAVFVGGESRNVAMCTHIARSLRLPAQIADPLAHLRKDHETTTTDVDTGTPQPGWAVPLGLCLCPADL